MSDDLLLTPCTTYPLDKSNSARYAPSWPVIPVINADFIIYNYDFGMIKWVIISETLAGKGKRCHSYVRDVSLSIVQKTEVLVFISLLLTVAINLFCQKINLIEVDFQFQLWQPMQSPKRADSLLRWYFLSLTHYHLLNTWIHQ